MSSPEIYFYVPPDKFSEDWPKSLSADWVAFGGGANIWSYFTAVALNELGLSVNITTQMPESGIVLSHSQYLPQRRVTNDDTMLVCIRADYGRNHPAHMHVVQNADQATYAGRDFLEYLMLPGPSYYIPQWPQPGLITRDRSRGNRFENIAFVGARQNLASELKSDSWRQQVENLGLNFVTMYDRASWHDYSQVDAVIAIRSMKSESHLRKPPSKLTNSWLAGVPALLGPESAFRALRRSEFDFIEVCNTEEALAALQRLRDDPELRQRMVATGDARSSDYTVEANARRWIRFFDEFAIPYYHRWIGAPAWRRNAHRAVRDLRAAFKPKK